jgi:membrane-associated phospholipid phosphatase
LKYIALGISIVLHPLLLPTWAFATIFYITPLGVFSVVEQIKGQLLLLIFLMTFLAPITAILTFYALGVIESLKMDELSDRQYPFLVTSIFYTIITWRVAFFSDFQTIPVLGIILGGTTISIILVTWISTSWKISAHSVGMCGMIGFMMGILIKYAEEVLFLPFISSIILAGLLMSARMYLNVHTPNQILAGAGLGFTIGLCSMLLFL